MKFTVNFFIISAIICYATVALSAIDPKIWPYVPDIAITVQNNSNRDFTLIINKNPSGKIEKKKSRSIRNINLSQPSDTPSSLVAKVDLYDPRADEYLTFYLFIKKIGTDREITTWLMHKNKKIVDEKETIRLSATDKDHYTIKIVVEEDISKSSVDVATSIS